MKDGFKPFFIGGVLGIAAISLIILITRYVIVEGLHKPFDTIYYWLGGVLTGLIAWSGKWWVDQLINKIEGKSDKSALENLEKVIMEKIKAEDDTKHEILTTMYNISGSIEKIDFKFDSKLTALNQTLMDHIMTEK